MAKVRRAGDGARVTFVEHEVTVLGQLLDGLEQVLVSESSAPVVDADPLVALTGLSNTGTDDEGAVPEDPAVRRLVPDAYEDPIAAAEFRRFTADALLAGKRESLDVVRAGLASLGGAGRLAISATDLDNWVRTLTDLRLVLGVRLGVVQASDIDELDSAAEDDPRRGSYEVFGWLGFLLDELLGTLT